MKRIFLVFALLVGIVPMVFSQDESQPSVVWLETTKGIIRIALFDDTPLHRDNFLRLVREGRYDGTEFHRVVADFMIQGGDIPGLDYTIPAEILLPNHYHVRGAVAAAREADADNPERASNASQFYIVWGTKTHYMLIDELEKEMAERGVTLTEEMKQDYMRRGGTPHLDGQYTVFGQVVDGLDVVEAIQKVETDQMAHPTEEVLILKASVENE